MIWQHTHTVTRPKDCNCMPRAGLYFTLAYTLTFYAIFGIVMTILALVVLGIAEAVIEAKRSPAASTSP